MTENSIKLILPSEIDFSQGQKQAMQMQNPYIFIDFNEDRLLLSEAALSFDKISFLELHFPFEITEEQYEKIAELNELEIKKIEYSPQTLYIYMGTIGLIGTFTVGIITVIAIWNKKYKKGKIFDSQADYILKQKDGSIRRKQPDVSFLAFKNIIDKMFNERGFIVAKPYFIIEVVSNKYSLQKDLDKMKNDWLPAGMEVGLVVCPFRQKYYLFEKGKDEYQIFDFEQVFAHEKLPELELNFQELLEEAKEN